MYYQINATPEEREKIEKYLKRNGVHFEKSISIEELFVLDNINTIQQIFDNMPFSFLNPKRSPDTDYAKQMHLFQDTVKRLKSQSHEIALSEPLFNELQSSIVKKCEKSILNALEKDPADMAG